MNDLDIHARQMHHAHCALRVFTLNVHLKIFLDLKPVIQFHNTWLSTNRLEVFMSTK